MGPADRAGSGNAHVVEMVVEEAPVLTRVLRIRKSRNRRIPFRGHPVNYRDGDWSWVHQVKRENRLVLLSQLLSSPSMRAPSACL